MIIISLLLVQSSVCGLASALPHGALVLWIHLASQRTVVRLGKLNRVRYRTDYSAHHRHNVIITSPHCFLLMKSNDEQKAGDRYV